MSSLSPTFSRETKNGSLGKGELGGEKATATILPAVDEDDKDEAQAIVGDERNEITQEEDDAVKRKVDMRVVPLLAAVYFSQVSRRARISSGDRQLTVLFDAVSRQELFKVRQLCSFGAGGRCLAAVLVCGESEADPNLTQLFLGHGTSHKGRALQPRGIGFLSRLCRLRCVLSRDEFRVGD